MKKLVLVLTLALGVLAFATVPAFAGKAAAPTGTITLDQTGDIHVRDFVTFTTTTTGDVQSANTELSVIVTCSQGTTVLFKEIKPVGYVYALNYADVDSTCVAQLAIIYTNAHLGQIKTLLATTTFPVLA